MGDYEGNYEAVGQAPRSLVPLQPAIGGAPHRDDNVDLSGKSGRTIEGKEKGKKSPITAVGENKVEDANDQPPNTVKWLALVVLFSILMVFSAVLIGLCVAHRWLGAKFVAALNS